MCIRILLVESDTKEVDSVRNWFIAQRTGATLETVANGEEALDLIFMQGAHASRRVDQTPQLVLLEVELPGTSGLEVLERIRGSARTRRIPVVLMTRARDPQLIERGYELGANSVIVKSSGVARPEGHPVGTYWALHNVPPVP